MENTATIRQDDFSQTSLGMTSHKLGILVFIASEIMFFGGLIGAYVVYRFGSTYWGPPAGIEIPFLLPFINTILLISSSFTMHKSHIELVKGNMSAFKNFLLFTLILGIAFLSIQAYEYSHLYHEGLLFGGAKGTLYGASFYLLTGFHGLHVTGGVIYLLYTYGTAFTGKHKPESHIHVEMAAAYWHFVDIVWIFLFILVYVIK